MLLCPSAEVRHVCAYERQSEYRAHACAHCLRVEGIRAIAQKKEASGTGSVSRAHECAQIPRRADLTNRHPTRAIVDRHLFETNDLLTQNCSDSRSALRTRNGSKLLGCNPTVRGVTTLEAPYPFARQRCNEQSLAVHDGLH